ncbi:helix-turn-helix domain-containing protein [Brevibacillus laterosporus]|uniref:Helix-turn-helix domain-containing protein n=1 Tax=Brevibacillus laterosporus TaxID=1465 RepID=A0AAP8U332_BRELA|nr:helix-turn-helix domain-containing protein [Brevibacillus laterosporus]PPA90104.1 hypothetical protein C4A77_25555 [Brevibacillus laterosporus]
MKKDKKDKKDKKNKTIVRVIKRESPFVQIDKIPINDERLSWKAKGLLVYLISKPDDWTIIISDLVNKAKDGRDSVYAGLKELEQTGYLSRVRERDSNGKFLPMEYRIYETPQITEIEPLPDFPDTDFPDRVNPTLLIMILIKIIYLIMILIMMMNYY